MGFKASSLWTAPEVNPINKKARSIPAFNPVNTYGRVFTFSWFGFLIAFLSWYAFPPLMTKTIKKDLHLTTAEVQNSNISALTATLLVRLVSGPLCDRFGPRYVFVGCLLAGAIPTALAGTVTSAAGLITLRFFIGILGASFVPCQVWSTGFFDKNVVGSANALVGGFGNAGGGITYFVMPAIFDSLVHERGLTEHVAWRVAFIVPFIIITVTAIAMLLLCPDTPVGKWADRQQHVVENLERTVSITEDTTTGITGPSQKASVSSGSDTEKDKKAPLDPEAAVAVSESQAVQGYTSEIIRKPTFSETIRVISSPQSIVLAFAYFNSFGSELAINSILGTYYNKNLKLAQTESGRWAAMFGLLNVAFRPAGGFIADLIYHYTRDENRPGSTRGVWAKKVWIHFLGFVMGAFCIAIGLTDPKRLSLMVGLIAGLAFFMDAGNGANFALVPHVHPHANGIVSGFTGATGNLGGIIFSIIFRFHHTDYSKVMWIIGVMMISMHLCMCWVKPLPKGQIGGH